VRRTPDDTWSEWSKTQPLGSVVSSPAAPFLQVRLTFSPDAAITALRVAYAERNLAPQLASVQVEPGGGLLASGGVNSSPAPVSQRFDDGLGVEYTVYQPRTRTSPDMAAWARGLRTVRWTASDPNDDVLRYHVEIRNLEGGDWMRVASDLEANVYAWDTRSFRDGLYQVRVVAHDGVDNPLDRRRSTTANASPVHVDNTAPRVKSLQWTKDEPARAEAEVEDASSALVEVAVRTDDGPWTPLEPEDGVLDGPAERFTFQPPPPPRAGDGDRVWLRAVDAAGNVKLEELAARR
jgi:hypothetical protein